MTDVSGRYEVAVWRGAALTAALVMAAVLVLLRLYTGWGLEWLHSAWGMASLTIVAAGIGAAASSSIAPLKRLLAGSRYLDERVHQRAMQAFVEEEVFLTRERTGILIFISLFEHRIEVLGDSGINSAVLPDDWAQIVTHLQIAIREGRPADGLIEAIEMCGDLLQRSGLAVQADDTNELANRVRLVRYER